MDRPLNVLFLCTGNSARSIMGEVMMNAMGAARFRAFSAGVASDRQGQPVRDRTAAEKPHADRRAAQQELGRVRAARRAATRLRLHRVRNAAGEVCPVWPGQPMSAHWGVADPAAVEGGDEARSARRSSTPTTGCSSRIQLFVSLPLAKLDRVALHAAAEARSARGREPLPRSAARRAAGRFDEHLRALPHGVGGAVHRRRHRARADPSRPGAGDRRAWNSRRSTCRSAC